MSKKSPTYKNFVPMNGYKDIFYNPIVKNSKILTNSNSIEKTNDIVKKTIIKDPEVIETYNKLINSMTYRPNILDRRKLNSNEKNLVIPLNPPSKSPITQDRPLLTRDNNEIHENIKSKFLDILFYEDSEAKFELVNNIIKFFQDSDIPEQKLILFLESFNKRKD